MLDPVKNAKAVGVLILLSALLGLLTLKVVFVFAGPLWGSINVVSELLSFIAGIGLLMGKRWAIYTLGLLLLFGVSLTVYRVVQTGKPDLFVTILYAIFIGAFVWFYLKRDRFT